jgi:hypothetical protein
MKKYKIKKESIFGDWFWCAYEKYFIFWIYMWGTLSNTKEGCIEKLKFLLNERKDSSREHEEELEVEL